MIRLIPLIPLLISVSGCVSTSAPTTPKFQEKVEEVFVAKRDDAATILIHRNKDTLLGYAVQICYDRIPVANIRYKEYVALILEKGLHRIYFTKVMDVSTCASGGNNVGYIDLEVSKYGLWGIRLSPSYNEYFWEEGHYKQALAGKRLVGTYVDPRLADLGENKKKTQQAPVLGDAMTLDQAKNECKELGFSPDTEAYGTCVLKLSQ